MAEIDDTNQATDGENAEFDSTTPAPQKRLRLPLRDQGDFLAELGRVYRSARAGLLPVADASRLGNLLAIMSNIHAEHVLSERLAVVEKKLAERK